MNSPCFFTTVMVALLVLVTTRGAVAAKAKVVTQPLCSDASGVFLGLAIDEESYATTPGSPAGDKERVEDKSPQSWLLTAEDVPDPMSGKTAKGPKNSYEGKFLQVLPDGGRSYPGMGEHLQHADDLEGEHGSPYVSFFLNVEKGQEGIHTLFLRWTGGDTVGGGDSLYVVLYKKERKGQKSLVHGTQTVKPAVVPIDAGMSRYAGCCYDMVTHACPCFSEKPDNATCPEGRFVDRDRAGGFGVQCLVGGGAMVIIKAPQWYLYAGQEAGDVMDFDSEPWDVTCEADGSNTRDSGHDFPSWDLGRGEYELRIYAREDGTALDGIYVAGPEGKAPTVAMRYSRGDSTICTKPSSAGKIVGISLAGIALVLLVWFSRTQPGREVLGTVLSKPAQAVRYVYVDSSYASPSEEW